MKKLKYHSLNSITTNELMFFFYSFLLGRMRAGGPGEMVPE